MVAQSIRPSSHQRAIPSLEHVRARWPDEGGRRARRQPSARVALSNRGYFERCRRRVAAAPGCLDDKPLGSGDLGMSLTVGTSKMHRVSPVPRFPPTRRPGSGISPIRHLGIDGHGSPRRHLTEQRPYRPRRPAIFTSAMEDASMRDPCKVSTHYASNSGTVLLSSISCLRTVTVVSASLPTNCAPSAGTSPPGRERVRPAAVRRVPPRWRSTKRRGGALRGKSRELGSAIGPVVADDDGWVLERTVARGHPGFAPRGAQVADAMAQ